MHKSVLGLRVLLVVCLMVGCATVGNASLVSGFRGLIFEVTSFHLGMSPPSLRKLLSGQAEQMAQPPFYPEWSERRSRRKLGASGASCPKVVGESQAGIVGTIFQTNPDGGRSSASLFDLTLL